MNAAPFSWMRLLDRMLDFCFPPHCVLCGGEIAQSDRLCLQCMEQLPPAPEQLCLRCGMPLTQAESGCGACLSEPNSPDAAYFAFLFRRPFSELVRGYKFRDQSQWAGLLGHLCWVRLGASLRWEAPDLVIPIPLHPRRLLWRRYNQSALLARELAHNLERPMVTNALKRIRMTPPQTRLRREARLENVRGAFKAKADQVKGRAVLLVDDVMTSGATIQAATRALKRAGAKRVAVVCLARTLAGKDNGPDRFLARKPDNTMDDE